MRRLWPFVVVLLLGLPASWPYLGGEAGSIPRTNDALTHLYRAVELDRLVRAGDLLPRWAPGLAHGYGYPIFNFFAYLSHYVIVLFHLAGLPLLAAMRASFALALCAAGLTMFLLARDLSGSAAAAVIAAAAYVYSPYLLYTAHVRGSLPEILALAFLPLALWAARRALRAGPGGLASAATGYAVIAALAAAGLITSHAGMALQNLPFIGIFGLYILLADRPEPRRTSPALASGFGRLAFILILALGLTALLWLPAMAELPYVQFEAAFARAGLTYRENFFRLGELFAYPRLPVYADVLNPPLVRSLPLVATGLALVGLLRLRSLGTAARAAYLFLFALLLAACFLTLDASRPIWESLGLLQRSAFPWRFLGPATLLAALLAALAVGRQPSPGSQPSSPTLPLGGRPRSRILPTALRSALLWLIVASALPFLYPPREPAPEAPTRADLARFEIPPLLVATTTAGEYTPIWVREFPDTSAQQAELIAGREPERLAIDAPGAAVEHLAGGPARDTYRLILSEPRAALYRSFYFPGWRVSLDGKPAPIRITYPDGLIAFDVPAGEHRVEVRFGTTPARAAAGAISAGSLAALLVLASRLAYGRQPRAEGDRPPAAEGRRLPRRAALALILAASSFVVSLAIAASLVVRRGPPAVQHPLGLNFGGELTLVGYEVRRSSLADPRPEITLVWEAQRPLGVAYGMNVRLADELGLTWSRTDIERPRDWRFIPGTDFWPPGQFIYDSYLLSPLPGTPPGRYHLEAIVYRADTLQALSAQRLGDFVVERATREPLAERPLASFDGLALAAADADRHDAAPGDPYRLTLRWQAFTAPLADRAFRLELVDSTGAVAHTVAGPVVPGYPPSRWAPGEAMMQYVYFRLPAGLASGDYGWRLNGTADLPVTLRVTAPARSFTAPPLRHPLRVDLGDSVTLLGYNLRLSGHDIAVDLAWQARAEMSASYRVFLHLLDAGGGLVSQSDGEPAGWSRPTAGWLPGEVVIDSRALTAPGPGDYTLWAGMVGEAGDRLAAAGWPGGAIRLGAISVLP